MAHDEQQFFVEYVRDKFPELFRNTKVVEIGSLNINGSVRRFFTDCKYLGVDLGPGKDVNLVCKGHELKFPDGSFDVAISCECLEHDKYWELTFKKMCYLAKELVVLTCASYAREEHGTTDCHPGCSPFTNDYYRNLGEKDFDKVFLESQFEDYQFLSTLPEEMIQKGGGKHKDIDLYFWGKKRKPKCTSDT